MWAAGILLALLAAGGARADLGHIGSEASAVAAPIRAPVANVAELLMLAAGPAALALFLWRRWDRLEKAPSPPSIGPLVGGLVFLGMLMAGAFGGLLASQFLPETADGETEPLWVSATRLSGSFGAQILFIAACWPVWRPDRARGVPGPRPRSALTAALLGLGALVLFWPMVNFTVQAAGFAIELLGGPPAEPVGHETLARLLESPRDVWLWVIGFLVIVPGPILEEILYRGVLQRAVRALVHDRWLGIVGTSLIFSVMHADVAQPQAVAGIFVLSLGFGWAYERTGRLIAPIVMHMLFNAANVALTFV
jgi:membrane protease YdiL (CAAX protease family)